VEAEDKGYIYSINIRDKNNINSVKSILLDTEKNFVSNKNNDKQISILSIENINKQKHCPRINKKTSEILKQGDFHEDITTANIDLKNIQIGDKLLISNNVIIEITKIGRNCYKYCPDYCVKDDCSIMKFFIFGKIISSGEININDEIKIIKNNSLK